MNLYRIFLIAGLLLSVTALLESESSSPIVKIAWSGKARVTGAYLISPIRLDFIDNICNQLISNLQITTEFVSTLISHEVLDKAVKDLGFIRRTSF